MISTAIALFSTVCIFGGALLGLHLKRRLPGHHLNHESKDTVKLGSGLLATLSALILGLLVSSAKNTFDTMNVEITQSAAKIVYLDRVLADYGPETKAIRDQLRRNIAQRIQQIWPADVTNTAGLAAFEKTKGMEELQLQLYQLTPANELQRGMLQQAQQICSDLRLARWVVIEQSQNAIPMTFLAVLLFWLTALHLSFGLFAPANGTVIFVLLVCALSEAGAIFLILEMSHPLGGWIKVSSAPMLKALEHLGQ
jgi:hypothetical protein